MTRLKRYPYWKVNDIAIHESHYIVQFMLSDTSGNLLIHHALEFLRIMLGGWASERKQARCLLMIVFAF